VQFGLSGYADLLGKGHLMLAMETVIERECSVRLSFFAERVQGLDNVVSRYRPMFYKRAFHFLRNATDAEDAVQDALLSAYKNLGRFRGQAKLFTWLTTIVIDAARMQLRRRSGYLSLDQEHGQDGLVRVLLVEDFEPFRRFIRTTLQTELQIIAEVSDGLEAVSKAAELQPDLILLDIGLPTLNGIEAARQIHLLSPQSKILFVSQESSADVIEEAMNSGALGYVVKAYAATDLLDAVEAVCQGRKFVSGNGSSGH
jgi:RNA polymerase sigma factor (sigma-70 family)